MILIDGANLSKAVCSVNTQECVVTQVSYQSWLKKEAKHQGRPGKQNPQLPLKTINKKKKKKKKSRDCKA